jgi:transposase
VKAEDLSFDKTDDKDAVLIARLTGQLRCYLPEPVDETWARLRRLGIRRARLVAEQVAQMRDLLECAWPAVLDAARQPFKSNYLARRADSRAPPSRRRRSEPGDPAHAGLAPRQKRSGTYTGRTRTAGQGRPALRLAAWRAV